MKSLGLIGGTSWHSTMEYYKAINQSVNEHFGNNTNPPLLLYNLNHAMVHQYQKEGSWTKIAEMIIDGGTKLQAAGAEALLLCANTQHKVYDMVEAEVDIPILHIADATSAEILNLEINSVCFLGTKFSMQEDFVTGRIAQNGIEVHVPDDPTVIDELHRIIHEELVYGKILPKSKDYFLDCVKSLTKRGAQGVVLGCTEFPLLIQQDDLTLPIFNTTKLHAKAAVEFILSDLK